MRSFAFSFSIREREREERESAISFKAGLRVVLSTTKTESENEDRKTQCRVLSRMASNAIQSAALDIVEHTMERPKWIVRTAQNGEPFESSQTARSEERGPAAI